MAPARGWDASSHESLLFAILDEVKPKKAFLMNVTERMKNMGYSYSYDAINQHIQKLRRNRDTSGIDAAAGGTPGTPRKSYNASPTKGKKKATPKKRKSAADDDDDDDEDDDDVDFTKAFKDDSGLSDQELQPKSKRTKRTLTPYKNEDIDDDAQI
ncbi:hypothetical protein GMORB2_0188 [Geosmithia morbida]|uniref:Uncharacterized protein n=1 Tax=Geosmithia morbida TaxID=1094350 RepID=A0A9P5D4T7_9HYPO|nr:uncharacterized protein GMORB2_0188 [Geosmithia morbida]KAF4126452.1 hypothetical protein GMORB2_0188 [Geosmithia morbida]